MKFKINKNGNEHITFSELMNPIICGIFFDEICEYCHGIKERYQSCTKCGGPSRFKNENT